MIIKDEIREIRLRLGLSQTELGAILGVHYKTVERWELGHGKPSPLALKQISRLQRKANKR